MLEVNHHIKVRYDRLKKIGNNVSELYFLMALFLFVRSLKTYSKKISEKLKGRLNENAEFLKDWIIKKRLELIYRRDVSGRGVTLTRFHDAFHGYTADTGIGYFQ